MLLGIAPLNPHSLLTNRNAYGSVASASMIVQNALRPVIWVLGSSIPIHNIDQIRFAALQQAQCAFPSEKEKTAKPDSVRFRQSTSADQVSLQWKYETGCKNAALRRNGRLNITLYIKLLQVGKFAKNRISYARKVRSNGTGSCH